MTMATDGPRNHDGLGKVSPLQRGMPVYPLHASIQDILRTRCLLRAFLWFDAGQAAWRDGEYIVSQQLGSAIYVASN